MFFTEAILPKPEAPASLLLLLLLTMLLAFVLPPSTLRPPADEGLRPSDPALLPALLTDLLLTVLLLGSLKPAAARTAAMPASAAKHRRNITQTVGRARLRQALARARARDMVGQHCYRCTWPANLLTWVLCIQRPQLLQHASHDQPQLTQLHVSLQLSRVHSNSLAARPLCCRCCRCIPMRAAATAAPAAAASPLAARAGCPLLRHAGMRGEQFLRALHCLEGACLPFLLLLQLLLGLSLRHKQHKQAVVTTPRRSVCTAEQQGSCGQSSD